MSKRAAIYARVSTDDQAEKGYSLPTQIDAMREYAAKNGFTVTDEISDECSGSIPVSQRPGGVRLYRLIQNHSIDVVILYTIDRTARDKRDYPIEFLIFLRDVQDAGAELHYVDTGKSEGSILDLFKAWQAGEERKKILERTRRGRQAKAKAGKWMGSSHPPYGYQRAVRNQDTRLEICEREAAVVRRIFDLYTGAGNEPRIALIAIAVKLSAEGVPPPSRSKQGKVWYSTSVKRILRNPVYTGNLLCLGGTVTISVPAIISPVVWEAAQKQTEKNRELARRNNKKNEYLLRGRLKCACGLSMVGVSNLSRGKYNREWKRIYSYYSCGRHRGDRHIHICTESYLPIEKTDSLAWGWVYELISNEDALRKGIDDWRRQNFEQLEPRKNRLIALDSLIARAARNVDRLAEAFHRAESDIEASALEVRRKIAAREYGAAMAEKKQLESELAEVELTPEREAIIRRAAKAVKGRLGEARFEQKREVLELLNFSARLGYNEAGARGLWCSCALQLDVKFLSVDSHSSG